MEYECRTAIPRGTSAFARGYLECAEWVGLTDEDRKGFDDSSSPEWEDESVKSAKRMCSAFQEEAGALLNGLSSSQAGHDLFLTQNHHGAGFWDRGLGEVGNRLTRIAHSYGSVDVFFDPDSEKLSLYGC